MSRALIIERLSDEERAALNTIVRIRRQIVFYDVWHVLLTAVLSFMASYFWVVPAIKDSPLRVQLLTVVVLAIYGALYIVLFRWLKEVQILDLLHSVKKPTVVSALTKIDSYAEIHEIFKPFLGFSRIRRMQSRFFQRILSIP